MQDSEAIKAQIIQVLRTVYDPEIPVNIYDLGLIYQIDVDDKYKVHVQMTLTAPSCPEAQTLPALVEANIRSIEEINEVQVELVWEPPWTRERMSEDARLLLGMF